MIAIQPDSRHRIAMRELLEPLCTAGNSGHDAHLAALVLEHGATPHSSDHDFARSPRSSVGTRIRLQIHAVATIGSTWRSGATIKPKKHPRRQTEPLRPDPLPNHPGMTVHLYAQVWNDERMLPFFFRHYDGLVDQYFIYDDGSTDGTRAILDAHSRVQAERFPRVVPESFALSEQALSDSCWKDSRGSADWVIVTDIDEHLVHPSLSQYLQRCAEQGVTLVPAIGFQMISDEPAAPGATLCEDYPMGAPRIGMMKASVFAPSAITEINYSPGRHRAAPEGHVVVPDIDELLLLHYKYLGFQQTSQRHSELLRGLGPLDHERHYGHKYSWSEAELRTDWEDVRSRAVDTRTMVHDPSRTYPYEPWWSGFRRPSRQAAQ